MAITFSNRSAWNKIYAAKDWRYDVDAVLIHAAFVAVVVVSFIYRLVWHFNKFTDPTAMYIIA